LWIIIGTRTRKSGVKMKYKSAMGAALLATFITTQGTWANTTVQPAQNNAPALSETEYDQTLPPVGFVKFCASNPAACKQDGLFSNLSAKPVDMTPERWTQLYQINTSINARIKPESDQDQYGEPERWAYPVTAGDCEDYALLKQRELEQANFGSQNLRMTVVLDEHGDGHAVLTVTTAQGDYVLDNRINDILLWKDTNYTFLKRQAADNPKHWVALLKAPAVSAPAVASAAQH
jgi:predicted transglutaminase-like cysteine proteinase